MIFTLGGVVIASAGLQTWRSQLRSEGTHSTALEIAAAVGNLHVEFFNHRAPLVSPWEFEKEDGQEPSEFELAGERYRRALGKRFAEVNRRIMAVHNLRGKALSVLGPNCAKSL